VNLRLGIAVLITLCVSVLSSQAQGDDIALQRVEDVEFVAWVTGPDSVNQTDARWDVDGTDLGSMFAHGDTLYIAFGDTFGCCRPSGGGAGGDNWRNNVLGYTTDRVLDDGITLDGMITSSNGKARAVLTRKAKDVTVIPTHGIAIGDRLYLHYMAVKRWGAPGQWTLNRSGWAYSDDNGQSWVQPDDAIWDGDTNFGQAALVEHEGHIYIFGIHGGRFGGVVLARVQPDAILHMSAYTYWDGREWVSDLEQAATIASRPVGELSVAWNAYLDRWIMTYLDEVRRAIVIREAVDLTGPWSEPLIVVSANDYPSLYGAYLHPWASDGEIIYFNMSQWVPYNVMLMRARLVTNEQSD
jgi:hypothetical protein